MLKAADGLDGPGRAGILTQVEREQAEREKREEEERLLQEQRLETAQGVIDSCISDVVTQAEREQAELEKKEEEEAPSGLSPWDGGEEYMNRSWADMMDEHDRKQSN